MTAETEQGGVITPNERAQLVPSIWTRGELNEIERLGINNARVWAMRPVVLRRDDLLSEGFCLELHRRMFGGIWRRAGRYRDTDAGMGWEPGRIPEGVRLFLDDAEGWIRHSTYPVQEAAVRLHHRLAAIRPWANGNHRHARLHADVLVASAGEAPLAWGVGKPDARDRYAEAIAAADGGDIGPLLGFARG